MTQSKKSMTMPWPLMWGGALMWAVSAQAAMVTDSHGNVGYDSAAECDAAMAAGTAKPYESFTSHPPLKMANEASVKVMKLGELPGYEKGACDLGVGRRNGRDGVSRSLIGKYVPYGPAMSVNVYFDAAGTPVRATMQQCDNNFQGNLPRPLGKQVASSECFADVLTPAKFETKTEQVVKVPATKRFEPVPATFKTVTEEVVVTPAITRQIPVPGTYKEVSEQVLVRPESFREEPVPPTYKMVAEQVLVQPEGKRIEIVPGSFKTVTEKVMVKPERKELKVVPATLRGQGRDGGRPPGHHPGRGRAGHLQDGDRAGAGQGRVAALRAHRAAAAHRQGRGAAQRGQRPAAGLAVQCQDGERAGRRQGGLEAPGRGAGGV